jgi:hypothetical protein
MTNEPIINVKFKKFRESYGLNNVPDGEAFEHFVNSAILKSHQPDIFTADSNFLDMVCIGGSGDNGIDGMAIKVNGIFVSNKDEINEIIKKFNKADIEIIFIQSKYKDNFNARELSNFINGVRNFLKDKPAITLNEKSQHFFDLKKHLMSEELVYYWKNNPSVRMYYVAMGKWRNNQQHLAIAEQAKKDIECLNIYEKVDVHFVDSEQLKSILNSNENIFNILIDTINTLPLTEVEGVDNSCIALCNGSEFAKMLATDEGVIRKSLFDDNVRDFQGDNSVNTEIFATIEKDPSKFILLNNGITVVCEEFITQNQRLKITNPQIVNGCQTCHVLFNAYRKGLDISKVPISVKFISTKDDEISNTIVRATNRQNIVMEEAFEATKKFHKDLEDFFNHINGEYPYKIFYERRSKQYAHNPTIKQTQRINLRILTQYFTAMFLNKPHISHRHESVLLREQANIIFIETQSKLPYFVASYSFFLLEFLFREKKFHPELKPYKAHLLMMFRESIAGRCPKISDEKNIDAYSLKIVEILKDDIKVEKQFDEVAKLFLATKKKWINQMGKSQFAIKDVPDFTKLLLAETQKEFPIKGNDLKNDEKFVCKGVVMSVKMDSHGYYFGFIKRTPNNIFFHAKQNSALDFANIEGKQVSYTVSKNTKDGKTIAINIKVCN